MKYPKSFIVPVLLMLVGVAGCAMFSCDGSNPERRKIVKAIAKTVLKGVCTAYKSGGNKLAESKIDSMVSDGKLTAEQAAALKVVLNESASSLEKLAHSSDLPNSSDPVSNNIKDNETPAKTSKETTAESEVKK
jgi:polyhydroxyalkanoate synthesis regulator phasin